MNFTHSQPPVYNYSTDTINTQASKIKGPSDDILNKMWEDEALIEEVAPTEAGAGVMQVSPDEVADVAGLEVGDTITFTVTEVSDDGLVSLAPTGSEEEAIPSPEPGAGAGEQGIAEALAGLE